MDRDRVIVQAIDTMSAMLAVLREMVDQRSGESLKISQVARELAASQTFVRGEIRHGRLKAQRFGPKTWRVSREDLTRYQKQRSA